MTRRSSARLNALICWLLAILLLGAMLMTEIRLCAVRDEVLALWQEKSELQNEKRILLVRLLQRQNLSALEDYAGGKLGMQHCRPSQCVILDETE